MKDRIKAELDLLRNYFPDIVYQFFEDQHWFLIPNYQAPSSCNSKVIPIPFSINKSYPGAKPYGFYVPSNLKVQEQPLKTNAIPHPPPFEGDWAFLSWQPISWDPKNNVSEGDNLWGWARGFKKRLWEGP